MTLLEIDELLDSTDKFDTHIESLESLDGQVVDLIQTVLNADGASLNDRQVLAYLKDLIEAAASYRTRLWYGKEAK
jgi:hypothetical protein